MLLIHVAGHNQAAVLYARVARIALVRINLPVWIAQWGHTLYGKALWFAAHVPPVMWVISWWDAVAVALGLAPPAQLERLGLPWGSQSVWIAQWGHTLGG